MSNYSFPRILIIGRVAWTKDESTLSSIFKAYPADKLAYICIETREPDFTKCANHFQISETALIKNLFNPKIKTGRKCESKVSSIPSQNEKTEKKVLGWVRKHRSIIFLYARELLWRFNGWKSKELSYFINSFSPDILFFIGDPLPLMNRFQRYILKETKLPSCIFMMDDIYSYKSTSRILYRYLLRRQTKKLIPACKTHFAISELMKEEYDKIFGINCKILTKVVNFSSNKPNFGKINSPIKFTYTGKLIYGRDKTLEEIARAIYNNNKKAENKAELHIYTQSHLTNKQQKALSIPECSFVHPPVPYSKVKEIIADSDIVIFAESLEKKYKYTARLSFSTKLADYLGSGKCIFAVGAKDIAPIIYLSKNNAAMICDNYNDLEVSCMHLTANKLLIAEYAKNAYTLGKTKHNYNTMFNILYQSINSTI